MSIVVTGKMNKDATERVTQSGDSQFFVNLGKKEFDHRTKESIWVNYSAALYAKQGSQADFYRNNLIEGAIVSISGFGVIPGIWGDNKDKVSLDITKPDLAFFHSPQGQQAMQQAQATGQTYQNAYSQPAPQQIQNQASSFDNFSDDIPF